MFKKTSPTFLSVLLATVLLFSFTNPVYQANFSGSWALNEGKSELGQFGARIAAGKIVVEQKADGVAVTRTTAGFDGNAVTTTETLANDGKESESTLSANAKKKSTLKWAADGNSFTIAFNVAMDANGQAIEFKGAEAWTLSADGKTLSLQNSFSTPQGDISIKAVYDKQ